MRSVTCKIAHELATEPTDPQVNNALAQAQPWPQASSKSTADARTARGGVISSFAKRFAPYRSPKHTITHLQFVVRINDNFFTHTIHFYPRPIHEFHMSNVRTR